MKMPVLIIAILISCSSSKVNHWDENDFNWLYNDYNPDKSAVGFLGFYSVKLDINESYSSRVFGNIGSNTITDEDLDGGVWKIDTLTLPHKINFYGDIAFLKGIFLKGHRPDINYLYGKEFSIELKGNKELQIPPLKSTFYLPRNIEVQFNTILKENEKDNQVYTVKRSEDISIKWKKDSNCKCKLAIALRFYKTIPYDLRNTESYNEVESGNDTYQGKNYRYITRYVTLNDDETFSITKKWFENIDKGNMCWISIIRGNFKIIENKGFKITLIAKSNYSQKFELID